jgi:hypothetical protein
VSHKAIFCTSEEEERVLIPGLAKMGSYSSALPLIFMCVVLMYFKRGKVEEEAGGGNGGLVMEEVLEEDVELAGGEDEREEEEEGGRGAGEVLDEVVDSNYHQERKKMWFQKVDALKEYLDANDQKFPKQKEGWLGTFWHNTKNRMKKNNLTTDQVEKLRSIGVPVENYLP